jgi:hypothetical protein
MILLPNVVLTNKINKTYSFSGSDSEENCLDLTHFKKYLQPIEYRYNSRGFRDQEWPDTVEQLKECIWCIGDSFTVGIGSPLEHTWPYLLQQATNQRTINISMDGASNEWISKIASTIADTIQPKNMVIMWSYLHRREQINVKSREVINLNMQEFWEEYYQAIRAPNWPDCDTIEDFSKLPQQVKEEIQKNHQAPQFIISGDLSGMKWADDEANRMHYSNALDHEDLENFQRCVRSVQKFNNNINVVHSVIPELSPQRFIEKCGQIVNYNKQYVGYFPKLDLARDGHHFDCVTAQSLVNAIIPLIL